MNNTPPPIKKSSGWIKIAACHWVLYPPPQIQDGSRLQIRLSDAPPTPSKLQDGFKIADCHWVMYPSPQPTPRKIQDGW